MKLLNTTFVSILCVVISSFSASAAIVSIPLGRWSPVDPVQTVSIKPAGATLTNETVRGFRITLPSGSDTLAMCIELGQNVSSGSGLTYTFEDGNSLALAARGTGTAVGAALGTGEGANVQSGAAGGIGDLRSAQVRYLFDNFWQGNNPSDWTNSTISIPAFQIAVWELSHDNNFSIVDNPSSSVDFYANLTPTVPYDSVEQTYNLAASMLSAVQAANVTSAYLSTTWRVVLLENSSFVTAPANGVVQDLVYAVAIPEPSTIALVLGGIAFLGSRRRRR